MGRKAQRNAREKAGATYKSQNLSRYEKKKMAILESRQCNEGWYFIQKEVSKLGHKKTKLQFKSKIRNLKDFYKIAKLNNSKSGAAPQTSPFFDVFDEVLSSQDAVNISKKKEVVFAR